MSNYLAIEQVRFADRLRIAWDVDARALDGLVPCFLLQPIVENAIRHGIAQCERDGFVEVSATRERDALRVRVLDSGAGGLHAQLNGHGIGLKNTRDRLEHFYRDGYAMRAEHLSTGGFEVLITIPYEGSGQEVVSPVLVENREGWRLLGIEVCGSPLRFCCGKIEQRCRVLSFVARPELSLECLFSCIG